jgi:2'-5' RNA ligase
MGSDNNGYAPVNQFALVSYLPLPLGTFLDRLRLRLVPECRPHAHVTVLPPRPLQEPAAQAESELREATSRFHSFEVKLGGVELFTATDVIYIEIAYGQRELQRIHDALNSGALHYAEPYSFHPHITLAQCLPHEQIQGVLENARRMWAEWKAAKSFTLDHLEFVQNTAGDAWLDLAHLPLVHQPVEMAR